MRTEPASPLLADPLVRILLVLLIAIAGLFLVQMLWSVVLQFGDLILLFVFAWVISFLLEPLVASLSRAPWLSRTTAVLLVYTALLVALGAGAILLAPILVAQAEVLALNLPELVDRMALLAGGLARFLADRGVSVADYTAQLSGPAQALGPWLVANAVTLATATASIVTQALLTLILSLYFMLDGERLGSRFIAAFPARYRDEVTYFALSVNRTFGGFLRGQIIQSIAYGLGIAVIMIVAGLPFAALVSFVSGLAMFVPFIGPIVGVVVPVLIALATGADHAWAVLVATAALNILVINVVAPKVMSQQVGLSPLMVLIAVIIGARVHGPWGALFAIPIAAVVSAMYSFYRLTVTERERRVVQIVRPLEEPPQGPPAEEAAPAEPMSSAAGERAG